MYLHLDEKYSLQYHQELNPKIFDENDKMHDDVRHHFLDIAKEWIDFAGIPENSITDIIFTGSLANYNYSRFSDCDIHIVFDPSVFSDNRIITFAKELWTAKHHIKVKGYSVELYAQPSDDELVASGVYSLTRNGWIKKPVHGSYNFRNDPALEKKVEGWKKTLDSMIQSGVGSAQFKVVKDKLKNMRLAALASGDEFSFDNLVFKALRNTGVFNRVNRYLSRLKDQELSL